MHIFTYAISIPLIETNSICEKPLLIMQAQLSSGARVLHFSQAFIFALSLCVQATGCADA